jgi:hypothetical protein
MKRWILAGVLAAAAITTASAQDKPVLPEKPAAPQQTLSSSRGVPLKVQFVLARYQGEKRLSSMPYTLGVLTGTQRTSLRMGIQVPVATSIVKDTATFPSYSYRDVGTNIDCLAQDVGNGQYQLMITVAESSVHADAGDKDPKFVRDVPVFRNFNAQFSMILRDGQTMQYVSVTDPLSGEVMRVDVTLNLAK